MFSWQVRASGQGIKTNSQANALCLTEMEGPDNNVLYMAPGLLNASLGVVSV